MTSVSPAHLFSDERSKETKLLQEGPEQLTRRMLWFFSKEKLKRISSYGRTNSYILGYGQGTRTRGGHNVALI